MARKLVGFSFAAITLAALVLTLGSRVSVAHVVDSATGSGHIHVNGDLRTFTFNESTDSSGVTTGQTEGKNRNLNIRWHGTINCLDVQGNVATMEGVATDISPNPNPLGIAPGNNILFQVIDNGSGKNAPPDLISLTFFFTGAPVPCTEAFNGIFATIPIEEGNVKVH